MSVFILQSLARRLFDLSGLHLGRSRFKAVVIVRVSKGILVHEVTSLRTVVREDVQTVICRALLLPETSSVLWRSAAEFVLRVNCSLPLAEVPVTDHSACPRVTLIYWCMFCVGSKFPVSVCLRSNRIEG